MSEACAVTLRLKNNFNCVVCGVVYFKTMSACVFSAKQRALIWTFVSRVAFRVRLFLE